MANRNGYTNPNAGLPDDQGKTAGMNTEETEFSIGAGEDEYQDTDTSKDSDANRYVGCCNVLFQIIAGIILIFVWLYNQECNILYDASTIDPENGAVLVNGTAKLNLGWCGVSNSSAPGDHTHHYSGIDTSDYQQIHNMSVVAWIFELVMVIFLIIIVGTHNTMNESTVFGRYIRRFRKQNEDETNGYFWWFFVELLVTLTAFVLLTYALFGQQFRCDVARLNTDNARAQTEVTTEGSTFDPCLKATALPEEGIVDIAWRDAGQNKIAASFVLIWVAFVWHVGAWIYAKSHLADGNVKDGYNNMNRSGLY
ncbi:MAG: hypothetical protein ACTSUE_23680 [Promethearchaeota archaeon]